MRFSKEEEYLRQKDKKLKKIIDTNGHIVFKPNKKNQFDTLVGIVISQFISTKAANSIFKNIREKFNSEYLNEKQFQHLTIEQIKKLCSKILDISLSFFAPSASAISGVIA